MRAGLVGLALAVAALAGCGDTADRDPLVDGRACQAIEFDTVQEALGVRFDTWDAARVDQSWSCVLSQNDRPFPDLTVVLSASDADDLIFRASMWPSGATAVESLGRIAYQLPLPPTTGQDGALGGPGLQVEWLSAAPQIVMLRYTWAAEATTEEVGALAPKLVDLARGIEQEITNGPAH